MRIIFVLKNLHSGLNKINWTRTISHSAAIVQQNVPVYLNPVNKKRMVNFDEELLVIFFSILRYLKETYGFPVQINVNFPLITGDRFKNYQMLQRIEILPYHTLGVHKYEAMGKEYKLKHVKENTNEQLEDVRKLFEAYFPIVYIN